MLVLGRRVGEGIWIGDDILVKVSSIQGNQVKLAIDAPRDVNILRCELENYSSSSSSNSMATSMNKPGTDSSSS